METYALASVGFRFRTTITHRWPGYATIAVLIALLGGVALGAVSAARRTQSAFPTYLASTNPSNLSLETAGWQPGQPNSAGSSLAGEHLVAHLPLVVGATNSYSLNAQPLDDHGGQIARPVSAAALGISTLNNFGSIDGEFTVRDRATTIVGRLPDAGRADEIDLTPIVAHALHTPIGGSILMGFYSNAQTALPGYGTSPAFKAKPYRTMRMKVVGLVDFNDNVVVDSLQLTDTARVLYSSALTRQLLSCCSSNVTTYLELVHGNRDVPRVEAEINRVAAANGMSGTLFVLAPDVAVAERASRPESVALGVFGLIAGLAALLIAGQAINRQLRLGMEERQTLRALGAGPLSLVLDGAIGPLMAVVVGSLVAAAVAVALSPLAPIGVVRAVYPHHGVAFDWPVLALGCLALVMVLGAITFALAIRLAPHQLSSVAGHRRVSHIVRAAGRAGLPASSVEGVRLAVDPGGGRGTTPVRSAILGALIAVVVLVATLTFGASLDALVSHPNLYGWNWDYELTGGGGIAPVPAQLAAHLLERDKAVASWSSMWFGGLLPIDGQPVADIGQRPGAVVTPPILSGHGLERSNQVVLGGETLAALHKKLGDRVTVQVSPKVSKSLVIVGTATMPVVGIQLGATHPSMGTGALVSASLIPASVSNANDVTPFGPSAIVVRLRPDVDQSSALAPLTTITHRLTLPSNYGVDVLTVQRPAEIINYRSMGTIPAILGLSLAAGAIVALSLTLLSSVRRRRRELAMFKALGFTRRQLAATVAWQASVAVGIGTLVGVPLGIVVGRSLWVAFAQQIDAVAEPFVPTLTIALVAVGAVVLANLVAAVPARLAADTPTILLLRAE